MNNNDKTIYISRRCEHCHELLILLHKNKNIFKFPVIDVDTKQFPKVVRSVPCMKIGNQILPGVELFKFLNHLIKENNAKNQSNDNQQERRDLMPKHTDKPDERRNLNKPPGDDAPKSPQTNSDEDLPGFCIGGSCDLGFSPLEGDDIGADNFEYLEGNESTKSCQLDNNITNKGEKSQQMDDDYSRLMAERGNDLTPSSR